MKYATWTNYKLNESEFENLNYETTHSKKEPISIGIYHKFELMEESFDPFGTRKKG